MGKTIREDKPEGESTGSWAVVWGWVLLIAVFFGFDYVSQSINEKANPPAYQMSEQDKSDGFERSCSSTRKSCTFDNAIWRLMDEKEYASHPECDLETSWCVVVKPLANNCNQIVVDGETRQTDGLFGQKIKDVSANLDAATGKPFKAGEPSIVTVQARGFLSKYLHVSRAYCQQVMQ
jgi:hypothetical protein